MATESNPGAPRDPRQVWKPWGTTPDGQPLYIGPGNVIATQNPDGGYTPWGSNTANDPTTATRNPPPQPRSATTTPSTPPAPPPGGGAPSGGSGLSPADLSTYMAELQLKGTPDTWTPMPTAPTFPTIPQFTAPTAAQAAATPGYQFAVDQGEQALQQSQAAQGLVNGGGSLKDILAWGQNYATQNYQNTFNNALSAYNTNTQTQYLDPYQALTGQWQTNLAAIQAQNQFLTTNRLNDWNAITGVLNA